MKKIFALIVTCCIALPCLSACGTDPSKTVRIYNAAEYIAEGVIEEFEQKTGYKVIYSEFASNEDMYTKMKTTSYDVLVPSDYMIEKLVREDLLAEIDYSNIPNYQYVDETFLGGYYDPENKYSVPYMWSTVGILYNTEKVTKPVNSINVMWDPDYTGKIFMLDSVRDTVGMTLKKNGFSVNATDDAALNIAKDDLIAQRPYILGYVTDEVKDKIISGEGYLGLVYSGEAGKAIAEKESLNYAIPDEGTIYCVDAFTIPKNAKNKAGAEAFINFMHKPNIAARNAQETFYGITNTDGKDLLPQAITSNDGLYPNADVLSRCEMLKSDGEINQKQLEIWNQVTAAN